MKPPEITHLASVADVLSMAIGVVAVALAVNRFAPEKRFRLRRIVTLVSLWVLTVGIGFGIQVGGFGDQLKWIEIASHLIEAYLFIGLVGIAVVDLALPRFGIAVADIVLDVSIGLAYLAMTFAVLTAEGVDLTGLVAASTIAAGVLTLSLQATLGAVIGGLAVQADGSLHVGDWVQLENGRQGRVQAIRWRHTVIETRDGDSIILPNSSLLTSSVTILGKREGRPLQHRMWVYFHVEFHFPPSRVCQVVQDALSMPIERVSADPKPQCICYDLAPQPGRDPFALYAVRYWLTDLSADDPTSSAVRIRIHSALQRAGIPLARPITEVVMIGAEDQVAKDSIRERGLKALRSVDLFRVLTDDECTALAGHLVYAPFVAGEVMTRQGAVAHWLYIVERGTAEVRTHGREGGEKTVATIEAPGFFGEMGLMTGEPRGASVVATSDVDCFRLDKAGFDAILHARPAIAAELSAILAKRRVELLEIRDNLAHEAMLARQATEQAKILDRIRVFFGLEA